MPLLDTYLTTDGVRVLVLPQYEPFDVSRTRSLVDIAILLDQLLQVCVTSPLFAKVFAYSFTHSLKCKGSSLYT